MLPLRLATLLLISFIVPATCLADTDSTNNKQAIRFGMLPFVSTHRLIELFLPIKEYLEQNLHRPVKLVTAPNFREYLQRSLDGEYDIYHTAPHFAVLAELEYGHRRLSRYNRSLDGSILVIKNGPIKSIKDLKGKAMITPDRLAIITMLGEVLVRENGLQPGKNITVRHASSHANAILSVAKGKVDAAVVSASVFEKMPEGIRSKLIILTKTRKVPNVMFMASPTLLETDYQAARKAMLNYTADDPGKAYYARADRKAMANITDENINTLRPYVKILKTRLE
jgi:phosphonate transport system substrate-binding protein